ncbi:MAG: 3-methyl-2-oxobutanoate hydroxymethyltransferase [bacterium]
MKKITVPQIIARKAGDQAIIMLTAYDCLTARLLDEAGLDILLVGDSLGMTALGYANTLPVTMDEMIHHTRAVAAGRKQALLVGDMPFMSYNNTRAEAVVNAGRFVKEGGAEAVKMEDGGDAFLENAAAVIRSGMEVMGHLGLTPQSVHRMGGFKVQGRGQEEQLVKRARQWEKIGCFSLVLEGMPPEVARAVTEAVRIPTIGIGAGRHCDGQVLVTADLLGLNGEKVPRFVKRYADLDTRIREAVKKFGAEVREGAFPAEEHTYK